MTAPRVLAVVLNWRQPDVTLACVQALARQTYPALDVLVIDNGSGDGSAESLTAALPGHTVLALPDNLGFAAGCNIGLRRALDDGYPLALLINNDAFAAADMVARLVAAADPGIALLTPRIFYEAQPDRLWYAGGRQQRWTLDLRDTGRGLADGPHWRTSRDVDYALGTCLLVNMAAAAAVGLLDERFFMYFEDLDWSLRLRQAGYRLRLVADARLLHRVAVSSGGSADTPLRRYYLARAGVLFWHKHRHAGQPVVIAAFRLASAVKMVARLTLGGQRAAAAAYLRGLRDGWRAARAA